MAVETTEGAEVGRKDDEIVAEWRRAEMWRALANDAAIVLSAFAVGPTTMKAIDLAEEAEMAWRAKNGKRMGEALAALSEGRC